MTLKKELWCLMSLSYISDKLERDCLGKIIDSRMARTF